MYDIIIIMGRVYLCVGYNNYYQSPVWFGTVQQLIQDDCSFFYFIISNRDIVDIIY